jgi:ribulose kinase
VSATNLFACIDLGTQGVRVGLIAENGELVAGGECAYPISFPRNGWAEQHPDDWYDAFLGAWGRTLDGISRSDRKRIRAACACATSSTVFPVDKDGRPLSNALMWMDSRAVEETEYINAAAHPALSRCGGEESVEWLIPKVLWFKRKQRDVYDAAFRFVEQLDWFNWKLTGEWRSSLCNATCKANYSRDDGGWNVDFLASIGLEDFGEKLLTDVIPVGEPVGTLHRAFCETYGLDSAIPLYQGGIDAYVAVLGLGVVGEGTLGTIMGTSFVQLCMAKAPLDITGIWGPYRDALIEGYHILEGGQISAGSIAKWFHGLWGNGTAIDFDVLAAEARSSGIGAHGLVALDFFQGNRTPYKNPRYRGAIWGLGLGHSRGDIYRALMESVAFGTRNIISNFNKFGYGIGRIAACGGVTKDELWLSIIADVCRTRIVLLNSSSYAGLMGCAMISAVSSGLRSGYDEAAHAMVRETDMIEPDAGRSESYDAPYRTYKTLCDVMKAMDSEETARKGGRQEI